MRQKEMVQVLKKKANIFKVYHNTVQSLNVIYCIILQGIMIKELWLLVFVLLKYVILFHEFENLNQYDDFKGILLMSVTYWR